MGYTLVDRRIKWSQKPYMQGRLQRAARSNLFAHRRDSRKHLAEGTRSRELNEQLEMARAFVDVFEARLAGDLLAEPQSDLPQHPLFDHLTRLWDRYLEMERQDRHVAELSCGVVHVDANGLVETVNARAIELLGFDNAGEVVGESVGRLIKTSDARDALNHSLALPSSTPRPIAYELQSANGPVYLELAVGPHTVPFQCSILVIDVTKRELLEKELRRARDLALAHERRTSEFLASMSHELRTPMNGVIGMVALLGTTRLDEEQLEIVQLMRRSGEHLLCIINDILDLAKLEAGHVSLDPVPVQLENLVRETVASHDPTAAQKSLNTGCELDGDVPYKCSLDPLRVRQVLTNLVGNAIKFTDQGRVTVVCTRSSPDRLRVEVRDTGIGIAEDQLPRLFQAFSQADSGATRRFDGTGLGLTISKKLIERMGGEIGVTSRPGVGSTFWFTLPVVNPTSTLREHYAGSTRRVGLLVTNEATVAQLTSAFAILGWQPIRLDLTSPPTPLDAAIVSLDASTSEWLDLLPLHCGISPERIGLISSARDARRQLAPQPGLRFLSPTLSLDELSKLFCALEPAAPQASERPNRPLGGATVLVVEDNVVNQKVVKRLLEKAGASVLIASDGAQAVECVDNHPEIEMVLMDCQMPVVDGFEATRRIRQGYPRLPVCALTADAIAGDKERCFDAGMNDYLTKPIQYELLITTVQNWLRTNPLDSSIAV